VEAEGRWPAPYPVDLDLVLGPFQRGADDPTARRDGDGSWWRAVRTPEGPAALRITAAASEAGREVTAHAWGPGADWSCARVPRLLGFADDPSGFPLAALPEHLRAHAGRVLERWRVPASGLVLDALVPAVLEQKVTGVAARRALRAMLRQAGEPAPGPRRLQVPPRPEVLVAVPSWTWHAWGVEPFQARTLVGAARRARRLEECADLPLPEARSRLAALPGIGGWTVAEVAARALGDPDAVSFGDYHLAAGVVYAFTGARDGDDAAMARLLEPFAGHRFRVQRIVETSGVRRPARGPRMPVADMRRL
jgi:3-methyladenine DNA glycosylase/8-oxoguanine DNA glycosylase